MSCVVWTFTKSHVKATIRKSVFKQKKRKKEKSNRVESVENKGFGGRVLLCMHRNKPGLNAKSHVIRDLYWAGVPTV